MFLHSLVVRNSYLKNAIRLSKLCSGAQLTSKNISTYTSNTKSEASFSLNTIPIFNFRLNIVGNSSLTHSNIISKRYISSKSLPRTFSRPIKFPDDPYNLTELVVSLIEAKRLDDAIALMLKVTVRLGNPVVPWNVLLTEITNQLRLNLAFKLFNEMKCYGVKPNERTYTILLDGCGKSKAASATEKAEALLREMKRRSTPKEVEPVLLKRPSSPFDLKEIVKPDPAPTLSKPSLFHYNNLLKVYARSSKLEEMVSLYEDMRLHLSNTPEKNLPPGCVPDIISYTIVANAFSRLQTDDSFLQALEILVDIREDNKLIRESQNVSALIKIDPKFLEALALGSRNCNNPEHLLKGLELIDRACDLNLGLEYPNTESYKKLPSLTSLELHTVSEIAFSPSILDLALYLVSRLEYHHHAWPIFQHFLNSGKTPDLLHFSSVISALCHRTQQIFQRSISLKEASTKNTSPHISCKVTGTKNKYSSSLSNTELSQSKIKRAERASRFKAKFQALLEQNHKPKISDRISLKNEAGSKFSNSSNSKKIYPSKTDSSYSKSLDHKSSNSRSSYQSETKFNQSKSSNLKKLYSRSQRDSYREPSRHTSF